MLFQEPPQTSFGQSVIEKVIYYLNYPFINQKEFRVSILSLLSLVLVILVASVVSRYLRQFLERRLLPRFRVDPGLQYTLLRVVHYVVIIAGLLYGLKLGLSIDLTSVAVILGFLSVGIGFGLQYIASDLMSGLILLFERPVRIGDRVKVGDVEGRVEKISVRTTVIITNDNIAVIVPNSELVRKQFINWSYPTAKQVRIIIPVNVAYGSDVNKVTEALVEAGRAVKAVLEAPAPKVRLKEFGDPAIKFELLAWIDRPHNHPQIRSDINYQIERLFRQYRIVIPNPQLDLHLRSGLIRLSQDGQGNQNIEALNGTEAEETGGESGAVSRPNQ